MNNNVKVCILDYGSGNVRSVFNVLSYLKCDVLVSNKAEDIRSATHVILPGVGAFGSSMEKIKKLIPLEVLEEEVLDDKKPFLGICVGMQVLSEKGFEFGEHHGLGWLKGNVVKLDSRGLSLPHIGWNEIKIKKTSPLFKNFSSILDFYFVHSFAFDTTEKEIVLTETNYGSLFCSSVQKENIFGVQFHPEKSQKAGQLLLKNFLDFR